MTFSNEYLASISDLFGDDETVGTTSTVVKDNKKSNVRTLQVGEVVKVKKPSRSKIQERDVTGVTALPSVKTPTGYKTLFELDDQFQHFGFICVNERRGIKGTQASEILTDIWLKIPAFSEYFQDGYNESVYIRFANNKESDTIYREKKPRLEIILDSNGKPKLDKNGNPRQRIIREEIETVRTKTLDSVNFKRPILIKAGDRIIYSEVTDRSKVTRLPSQRELEHKSTSGFSAMKKVKLKANTGTKAVNVLQKTDSLNKKSAIFSLPGFSNPLQVLVGESGIIFLNEFNPSKGYINLARVAQITGYTVTDSDNISANVVFHFAYFRSLKMGKDDVDDAFPYWERFTELTKQINRVLNSQTRDPNFVSDLKLDINRQGREVKKPPKKNKRRFNGKNWYNI